MSNEQRHTGGCHCGAVRFEVTTNVDTVVSCNCSMCQKKGTLLTFVPASAFEVVAGENDLTDYQFNKHVIHHLFCRACGVTSFSRGKDPRGNDVVAINARCLDGVDIAALKIKTFDGRSL